jgi:hypothetical protein
LRAIPTYCCYLQGQIRLDDLSAALIVELPSFEVPIIYEETLYPTPQQGASGAVTPLDLAEHRRRRIEHERKGEIVQFDALELVQFLEYENEHDNPVEDKYRVSMWHETVLARLFRLLHIMLTLLLADTCARPFARNGGPCS